MKKLLLNGGAAALCACAAAAGAGAQDGEVQVTARDLCVFGADQIAASADEALSTLGALTTDSGRIDRDQSETIGVTIVICEGESSGLGRALSWRIAVVDGAPVVFDVRDASTVYYDLAALQAPQTGGAQITTEEVCEAGAAAIARSNVGDLADIGLVDTREFSIDELESDRYGAPVAVCEGDQMATAGASLIWRVLVASDGLRLIYVGDARRGLYRLDPDDSTVSGVD